MTESIPQLTGFYSQQLLSQKSDIFGEEDVCRSAEVYVKTLEANEVQMGLDTWQVPERFPPMLTFPPHIMYHLRTYFGEECLLRMARDILANQCSEKWRARLHMYDVSTLLAVDS